MPDLGAGKPDHAAPAVKPEEKKSVAALLLAQDKDEPVTPPNADEAARLAALQSADDGSGPGKSTPPAEPVEADLEDPDATPPAAAPDEPPEGQDVDEPEPAAAVEDEEPVPPTQPSGRTHKVKLADGTETEEFVSDDEAHNGYLRTADYTRKTQAAAEARKAAEAAAAEARTERVKLVDTITKMEQALDALDLKKPDASKLTPAQFAEQSVAYDAVQQRKAQLAAAKKAEVEKIASDAAEARKTIVEQEFQKLVELVPDWIDDSKRQTEFKAIHDDLVARGFSPEAIEAVDDHKLWLLARDAAAYRRLQKGKPVADKKLEGKLKPAAPGASKPPKVTDKKREALTDLKKSRGDRAANSKAATRAFEVLTEK